MKINETQHGQVPGSETRKSGTAQSGEGRFQEIMEQAVQKAPAGGPGIRPATGVPVPDGVQIIPGMDKVRAAESEGTRNMLLGEIRETLDMVDRFAADLGNTALSAADMKPLVEHLEDRLQSLQRVEADPHTPEALRSVVSDLLVTIGTEVAKYGRGDYE